MTTIELPTKVVVNAMIDCIHYDFKDPIELSKTMLNLLKHCSEWEDFDWYKIKKFVDARVIEVDTVNTLDDLTGL